MRDIVLDILSPEYCSVCGKFLFSNHKKVACGSCCKLYFKPFIGAKCKVCGYPLSLSPGCEPLCRYCFEGRVFSFDNYSYFGLYEGLIEVAIKKLKIDGRKDVAQVIGGEISFYLRRFLNENGVKLLTFVPAHKEEKEMRGFNQCEMILEFSSLPFVSILEKMFHGKKQAVLGRKGRKINVKGLFKVKEGVDLSGKNVCIFDDIFTTGSTVNEVATVLKEAGAHEVSVFTVARSVSVK